MENHVRVARKTPIFAELRDGSGFRQCIILKKQLCDESQVKRVTRECTIDVVGELKGSVQDTPTRHRNILLMELRVKAWRTIGDSPFALENVINKDSSILQRVQKGHRVRAEGHNRLS